MIFRQLFDKESSTHTYLIGDEETRTALLVDPVLAQLDRDLKLLQELGLKLAYGLETHVHADHVTSTGKLREITGCLGVVPQGANVGCANRFVNDGDILVLGAVTITAIATPGHTDAHMAYRIDNDRVLTGDALFIRGCGRTDFQSGDAGRLYDSVTRRLFTLADDVWVYPGHDYRGFSVSTIGEEKRGNPRFVGRTRSQFIDFMAKLNLPVPQKMMEALPANEHCGMLKAEAPALSGAASKQPKIIEPAQLKRRLAKSEIVLIDLREPSEFAREHIAGAKWMALDNFNPAELSRDKPIVAYCDTGVQSAAIARQLASAGFDASHLKGGLQGWKSAKLPTIIDLTQPISLQRQVYMVAGSLVVIGCLASITWSPWFLALAMVVGGGLMFSGATANCLMARLLAKLPYNRPRETGPAPRLPT